jgi:RTX calcium-binding nonapeptide repeat (4 copies)
MDVRGPKRAAARRLIQGTVLACAAVAACAPAAGAATVDNIHPPPAVPEVPEPAPATYSDTTGVTSVLTLTSDGPLHNMVLTDSVGLEGPTGIFDGENTCDATDITAANSPFACPLASQLTVGLGGGDDTLVLGNNMPTLNIDGGPGTDKLDFGPTTEANVTLGGTSANLTVSGVENVDGSPGGDTVTGDAADNTENGKGGNDVLRGEGGIDHLDGGDGVNALYGGPGVDTLTAGNNGDRLVGGDDKDVLIGGTGEDTIVAADGVADEITCNGGGDTVVADLTIDVINDSTTCGSVTGKVAEVTTTSETPIIIVPSVGSPRITPVLAPGKADIKDLTPPGASLRQFTRQRLKTVATKGVPIRVRCSEACGISVALSVDRKTAQRLKLDARSAPVVIGTATATRSTSGTTVLRVKFLKRARPALQRSKRAVTMTTQVLVSDASGNGTLLSRHVTLVK